MQQAKTDSGRSNPGHSPESTITGAGRRSAVLRFTDWLLEPAPSPSRYVLKIWAVWLVGAVFYLPIARWISHSLGLNAHSPHSPPSDFKSLLNDFPKAVLIGPAIETLLMIPIFRVLNRASSNKTVLAGLSALLWGALHATSNPTQGVSVLWSFFLLSSAFLAWRQVSLALAYWVTYSIHALTNLLLFALTLMIVSLSWSGARFALAIAVLAAGVCIVVGGFELRWHRSLYDRVVNSPTRLKAANFVLGLATGLRALFLLWKLPGRFTITSPSEIYPPLYIIGIVVMSGISFLFFRRAAQGLPARENSSDNSAPPGTR